MVKKRDKKHPNFDKLLRQGHISYDKAVGDWWASQSNNKAHQKAYHQVSSIIRTYCASLSKSPMVLDFASGEGSFLHELVRHLPQATFIGLDGSEKMLSMANKRFEKLGYSSAICSAKKAFLPNGPQFRLIKSVLPNFNLPAQKADIVVYFFPNLTCSEEDAPRYDKNGYKNRQDVAVARLLARFREMDPEDEVTKNDEEDNFDELMTNKVISRNLHHFLKPGGLLFRIEYANAPREELSLLTNWRSLFGEGALEEPIKSKSSQQIFKYIESRYQRSQVILDVYHQTGDPSDKRGGYFCTVLKAL